MLSSQISPILQSGVLFQSVAPDVLASLAAQAETNMKVFNRDEIIAFEGDPCVSIGIVVRGTVHIQRLYPSGKSITIEILRSGDNFGEALLFADPGVYPATLIATEQSTIFFIPRDEVLRLLEISPAFCSNMLRSLSNRILLLNRRIKGFTFGTVRQKVANYLLEEYARQKSRRLAMQWARHELADALGIPRPSLSRELISMREAGWILFDRKTIEIVQLNALEDCLEG